MTVVQLWWLSLGSLLAIHLGMLPSLRKRLQTDRSPSAIGPLAWFKVFAVLRSVALAIAVGSGLLWLVIQGLAWRGMATVEQVSATLGGMRQLQSWAQTVDMGFATFVMAALAGGLCWLTYKQSRQQATELFAQIDDAERDRVVEAFKADEWDERPPTELMQQVNALFQAKQEQLAAAQQGDDAVAVDKLNDEIDELRKLYFRIDAERRMAVEVPAPFADDLVLPPTAHWADRLRHALFNRGVLKSMSLGARVLAFAGLVLLIPAAGSLALGVGQQPIEEHVVRLEEVRIALGQEAAERELAQALKSATVAAPPPAALTDEQAEAEIVEAFDRDFNEQLALRAAPVALQARLARAQVREQILSQYARTHPELAAVGGADEAHAATDMDQARERLRERVRRIRAENAAAWQNLKAAVPSRGDFAAPVGRAELRHALGAEVYRTAFAGGVQELSSAYNGHATHYVSELARGGDLDSARARAFQPHAGHFWTTATQAELHGLQQHADADGHLINRALQEHPPTLHAPPHTAQQIEAAEKALSRMPQGMRSSQALYGFGDLLPGRLGDDLRTPAARVAQNLDLPGASGGSAGSGARTATPSSAAFKRSYSYASLRGFSRVGGVLIGRPPESDKIGADIVGLKWGRPAPGQVSLSLQSRNGTQHSFGPYPVSLVLQGLTYAADQRPLAVTMITAEPVPDLKIITHPALLDTATGCRAVALDRIADEATSRSDYRRQAEDQVQQSHALYRLAWGHTVARLAKTDTSFDDDDKVAIGRLAQRAITAGRQVTSGYEAFRQSLRAKPSLPLTAKPGFYDAPLVQVALRCLGASTSPTALGECLAQDTSLQDLQRLLRNAPEFQIWSGVRELPYDIDPQLQFLRPAAGASSLWPFDFILQTAFSRKGLIGDQEVVDDNPWEFPAIHDQLRRDVAKLVATNPERRQIVAVMRDFTVVQRLFRAALAGQLGEAFPLARLAELSRELSAAKPTTNGYKTPRWNTRDIELQYGLTLHRMAQETNLASPAAVSLAQRAPAAFLACARVTESSRTGTSPPQVCQMATLTAAAKALADDARAPGPDRAFAGEVQAAAAIVDLRWALGVNGAENRGAACPPL